MEHRARRPEWLGLALLALAGAAALAWEAWRDPRVPFLPGRSPGQWITEDLRASPSYRPGEPRTVEFHKVFAIAAPPVRATLRFGVHRAGSVELDGRDLDLAVGSDDDWKRVREREVTNLLAPGVHEIVVRASASYGPPAVWVALEGPGLLVASDSGWSTVAQGGELHGARPATTPMSEWAGAADLRPAVPIRAWLASLPWLAAFALFSALALVALRRLGEPRPRWVLLAAVLALGLLGWHDRGLPPLLGFDAGPHLDYVRFIFNERRLPLATDGWSMYHPPLYYAVGAALFALAGPSVAALRALNWLALVVQCAALLGSLRLLFPAEPRRVLAGFTVGACVPMQLYLAQYVTNELWAAAFASAALWLCLRVIVRDDRSTRSHLALGALLGAALLTKFSALLVALVVIAVLGGRLLVRRERVPRVWLSSVGAVAVALLLVAGWHYARVWRQFGSPLVGNWHEATGFRWWQDPGYRTIGDYLRFGDALTRPIYSAFDSCPDALYSTLWGDGLVGGRAHLEDAPPWRYELMFAGYWLALLPALGVAVGLVAAAVRLARAPAAEWALLLGLAGTTAFALLSLSLRLPFYAQCKAFYGLPALVPFAAFGAVGLDLLARRLGRAAPALWVLLGTWALCSFATYWAR